MDKLPIDIFLNENVYNVKAFNRAKVAHANNHLIIDNVAYNEVDSVVYVKNKTNISDQFVSGRKYSYAIECLSGTVEIEVNSVNNLTQVTNYDDLTDNQYHSGSGDNVVISSNTIVILNLDEAFKYSKIDGQFIEYKIAKDGGIK